VNISVLRLQTAFYAILRLLLSRQSFILHASISLREPINSADTTLYSNNSTAQKLIKKDGVAQSIE